MRLSDPDLYSLKEYLLGTANSLQQGLQALGLDPDEYDDTEILADLTEHIELCNGCDWWYDIEELDHTPEGDLLCAQCLEEERQA